jgi:hypothetical protein
VVSEAVFFCRTVCYRQPALVVAAILFRGRYSLTSKENAQLPTSLAHVYGGVEQTFYAPLRKNDHH